MTFSKRTIEKKNTPEKAQIPFITDAVYEKQKQKSFQYSNKKKKDDKNNNKKFWLWRVLKILFWLIFDILLIGGIA